MRVDKILHQKWMTTQKQILRRKQPSNSWLYQEMKRVYFLPDIYDSEDEETTIGPGGLVPNTLCAQAEEMEDYGGEAMYRKRVLSRALRRLGREDGSMPRLRPDIKESTNLLSHSSNGQRNSHTSVRNKSRGARRSVQPAIAEAASEGLDALDMDLLGEGPGGMEDESMMYSDPNDQTDDGDLTEDDFSFADPYASVK
jgi:hypothetical protein